VQCDYCKNPSPDILRLVLNDYDQETKDFHDWTVRYKDEELDAIIAEKSGIDFGHITALVPLHRGASGRIDRLKIVGTKRTEEIGKELKIRLWLSKSCLYSSWFEVSHTPSPVTGKPSWTLIGHGWGHGAGLCQIGAAVMASEGHTYEQILAHYYVGSRLSVATL
jgi:SpoIID/LytB domain protein